MTKHDEKKQGYFSRLFKAGMGQCPSPEEIIAYVEGEKVDPSIEHHLRHCSFCRAEMEDIRSELTPSTMRFSPQRLKDLSIEKTPRTCHDKR